jgi:prepilin-type N-terminal cleavage/methylation domain-containing protein/prepilin-type processing-associated H-X9-DG protein
MIFNSKHRASDRGVTLIEILVVISVIALLLSLLIPAVLAARESSRKIHCANNLHQIGLGIASYTNNQGAYPGPLGYFSPLVRILPYIDQTQVYDSINFNNSSRNSFTTAVTITIQLFICPSDSKPPVPGRGMTNYAVNGGTGGLDNAPFSWSPEMPLVELNRVTDGLSTTALASEWLRGGEPFDRDARRSVFQTEVIYFVNPGDMDKFANLCKNLDPNQAKINGTVKGASWLNPDFGLSAYNHCLSISNHTCTNGTLTLQGSWTADSGHSSGCNLLFGDAHVSFVKNTISLNLWRGLGTMNGGEMGGPF